MQTSILAFFFVVCIVFISNSQDKVKEKNVIGNWKLVIDIENELDDAKEDLDKEDNFLGDIILSSVSGLVNGILDEIDIYMEFRKGGELRTVVEAFGERETEYSEWWIDNKGRLRISSDNDHFSSDENDYWLLKDGILISYEDENDPNKNIYLVNID